AGMAAAIALKKHGVGNILLLDRNPRLGGILNQCIHPGFGLLRYKKDMTGPEYARALEAEFAAAGAESALGAMVLGVSRDRLLRVISPESGYAEIRAETVIVATGCRERTRENLEIAGTRPTGVFTAGQAQNLVNLRGYRLGGRVVIQGSGDIGLIMARRLTIEGCKVEAVLERLPYLSGLARNKVQCLDHFGIPLRFGAQISRIDGARRVEGVAVQALDDAQRPIVGAEEYIPCDTVLFSVGLIPEVDILKEAGILPKPGAGVPVNSHFEALADSASTSAPSGVFLCGNALHIHDLADNAAAEGEKVASHVALYLSSRAEFAASARSLPPYKPIAPNTAFDQAFFHELEASGSIVCIGCPRGCMVSAKGAACPRGEAYYAESLRGRFQPLTTTLCVAEEGGRRSLPLHSLAPVEVGEIKAVRDALSRSAPPEGDGLSVEALGKSVAFSVCR
ncbi:FAD-dependent oxidoreductase, partial [bacterium]|nr:FAD-dependent oxidoreductase [bacterium]